jgi:hypothetical protein
VVYSNKNTDEVKVEHCLEMGAKYHSIRADPTQYSVYLWLNIPFTFET